MRLAARKSGASTARSEAGRAFKSTLISVGAKRASWALSADSFGGAARESSRIAEIMGGASYHGAG